MVKLPVIVYNRTSRSSVIQDAIQLRNTLEQQTIAERENGGAYVRPIVLFQAQPKNNDESDTFDKVKNMLIEIGIPQEQIGIKTSKIDDINKLDLMSENCQIRYIITVNALKEGWDCSFAYILASFANKTSKVDVEQIVGRILRHPNARKCKATLLNTSFVFTCSNDFQDTLKSVVKGLNRAGFSRKDYRIGEEEPPTLSQIEPQEEPVQQTFQSLKESEKFNDEPDNFYNVDMSSINVPPVTERTESTIKSPLIAMVEQAQQQAEQYEQESEEDEISGLFGGDLADIIKQYQIQEQYREQIENLRIPQFFIKSSPDLFGGDTVLLDKNSLLDGFNLSEQDADINFTLSSGEMYSVDIQSQGDAVPKYKKVSQLESQYLQNYFCKDGSGRKD